MKRIAYVILALLGAALFAVPIMRSQWVPDQITHDGTLRIVSLSPSVTEMLFALSRGDSVVGVTEFCNYPAEAKKIERIGGFGAPNIERLLALSPHWLIGTGLERHEATEVLRRSGTQILWVKTGSFPEVFQAMREIGRAVERTQQAEQLVSAMQAELDVIEKRHGDTPDNERPRVFVEIWNDPLTTAGGGSFMDELITLAGGVNVAHEIDAGYPTINPENVVEWDPEVILLGYMTQEQTSQSLADRIGWSEIEAVRSGRIISDIPSDLLLRPGPRLIEGVRLLSQRLHDTTLKEHAAPVGRQEGATALHRAGQPDDVEKGSRP